jgi:hypothetical protein
VVCASVPKYTPSAEHQNSSRRPSADPLDDLDQLIQLVALPACERNEFLRALDDGAAFRCSRDRDSAAAAELEQSLVSEQSQGTQHGVRVDTEDRGEILCRRHSD